jgi:hypothetical protein
MAQLPTSNELHELETFDEPSCVTIYAPSVDTEGAGANNPERIELKNLLRQAETELQDEGVTPHDVRKTLRPAWELIDNPEFMPLRGDSFAVFASPHLFRLYHLPAGLPHLISIGRGFQLGPLQGALRDNKPYLVLALSHKHVRMFEGDRFGIRQLRLKNFPGNMKESLGIDEYPNTADARKASPAGNRRKSEITHSEYSESQTDKEMLLLFFRKIDASLHKFLQRKSEPMVLAGVEYLLPIYRQANTSPYLVPGGLAGNIERVRFDTIRKRAWELLKKTER